MERLKKNSLKFAILFLLVSLFSVPYVQARSGCCSWHGGVSYCDSSVGRYVCNDGTYSPSCGCYMATPTPTPKPISKASSIISEATKAKAEYYKNPNGFRENLINKIRVSLNINALSDSNNWNLISYWVYTMLPDVK